MKNFEYICMAIVFVVTGLSLGISLHTESPCALWQANVMWWVGLAFVYKKRLDKLNK